jgi:hypothetical protein
MNILTPAAEILVSELSSIKQDYDKAIESSDSLNPVGIADIVTQWNVKNLEIETMQRDNQWFALPVDDLLVSVSDISGITEVIN